MSGPSWVTCTGEANLTARLPGGRQVRGKTRVVVDQRVGQATPAPCGTSDVSRSIAVRVRPPRNTGLSILTVRVMGQPLTRSSDRQSLAQRLKSQFLVQPVAHRPANHPAREEIQDHGQVEPALTRPHVREILSANSEGWRQRSKAGHARLGTRPSVQPVYDPQDVHRSRRTHLLEAGLQEPDIPAPAHSEYPHTL